MFLLELNHEEVDVLKSAIKAYSHDLHTEIVETTNWELKETLQQREIVLLGVASQLGKKTTQHETPA